MELGVDEVMGDDRDEDVQGFFFFFSFCGMDLHLKFVVYLGFRGDENREENIEGDWSLSSDTKLM